MILTQGYSADNYKEVTAAEKTKLETAAQTARDGGLGVRTAQTPLYEQAGAVFNDRTGYYELNELTDLTEADMALIHEESRLCNTEAKDRAGFYMNRLARTLYPITTYGNGYVHDFSCALLGSRALETLAIRTKYNNDGYLLGNNIQMFYYCYGLKKIITTIHFNSSSAMDRTFYACYALESIKIADLNVSLSFEWSPNLSLESLQFMVDHAATTRAITIELHDTAFARLTDELIAQAGEKQITFVTPE